MAGNRGKFRVTRKDNQLFVRAKLDSRTVINERELQIFQSKLIRGLMRPVVQGRRITYSAPDGVPIMRYLGGGISVNDFFLIIAQVVEVTKKIDRNGFNINCLVLDYSYVFVNLLTKEVHFIYQPILTQNVSQNIFSFLYDLVFHTVLKPTEDRGIMDRFVDRLHRLQTYRPSDVEQILLMLYPAVYKQFQRSKTGQSGMLSDKKWANGGKRGDSDENPTRLLDEDENATGYMSGEDDATGLLNGDAADMGFSPFWDGSGSAGGFADGSEQATGLLDEDEQATGLLDSGYATGLPDEEGTALLGLGQRERFPYIVRLASYEHKYVDKPVFRIGKERSYVDFFVPDNNVVSRIHADILTENREYFIRDNHSTNGTYVNGSRLEGDQRVRLNDGDRFTLANEEFEFHME